MGGNPPRFSKTSIIEELRINTGKHSGTFFNMAILPVMLIFISKYFNNCSTIPREGKIKLQLLHVALICLPEDRSGMGLC